MELKNLKENDDKGQTASQQEAITWGKGPLMVLAGPGSGKTFVIVNRVKYLISHDRILPRSILVVTFSRAAALEMEERLKTPNVTVSTFHSFYFSILRKAYGYSPDQVVAESERLSIMINVLSLEHIPNQDLKSFAADILSEISIVKEERIDLDNYYPVNCSKDVFKKIYNGYEMRLGEARKIDYEDMLLMTYELLRDRQDIRQACEKRFRYILVDEFQDIDRLQYEILGMIAGDDPNLTVVGDDDQSIYRFRGARPEIMLGFPNQYPGAGKVVLDINFRSTKQITDASLNLIRHNKKRYEKRISSARGDGKNVSYISCRDPRAESRFIVSEIREMIQDGVLCNSIAVLYRTNMQPRFLIDKLMKAMISFSVKDSAPGVFEHWIAKDICAYLLLSRGIASRHDLVRIANRPNRYIKREALRNVSENGDIEGLKEYYSDTPWMLKRIDRLKRDLFAISRMNVVAAIIYIRKTIGYDGYLEGLAQENNAELSDYTDILEEVSESAEGFSFVQDWFEHERELTERIREKHTNENDRDGVRLMTFHSAKGLEFDHVFILDANEGVTPYRKAKQQSEIEEERRMFYVAMTRAKNSLTICTCKSRFHRDAKISRFIAESRG